MVFFTVCEVWLWLVTLGQQSDLYEYSLLSCIKICIGQICGFAVFRSTSESRPNSIEGKNVRPSVRPSVRTSVRPYVRPSTKSFFNLNESWYIGRGR